jgi:hypothetical protein
MSRHIKQNNNDSFICANCSKAVPPAECGTHFRNHCPFCLFSSHVDICTGDRRSGCRGLMEPIGIWAGRKKEWSLIHRCIKCGIIRTNRIAGDDSELLLILLATRPFMSIPFPAETVLKDSFLLNIQGVRP